MYVCFCFLGLVTIFFFFPIASHRLSFQLHSRIVVGLWINVRGYVKGFAKGVFNYSCCQGVVGCDGDVLRFK